MTILTFLNLLHFTLVLLFGLVLSAEIAGVWDTREQRRLIYGLSVFFLLLQGIAWILFGTETVREIYPIITHLPLTLALILLLKCPAGVAVVSVCTAYLCCQIPRWAYVAIISFSGSELVGELCYNVLIIVVYLLLHKYFVKAAHLVISRSTQTLLLFGGLPMGYYLFDYATTVYSDALYTNFRVLHEFLPTVLVVFYVLFMTAYHLELQKHMQTELHNSMLELQQKQTQTELALLRQAETQAAIYQHDMRHHLRIIEEFLRTGQPEQAAAYIHKAEYAITSITPRRFCENEIINLLCGSFFSKAEQLQIQLNIKAKVPKELSVSDTDLCALLSNGIENALNATANLEQPFRYVDVYCERKQNKLLIEIRNPYIHDITMENGIPLSDKPGHGYGCQSIRTITERYHGICTFQTEQNIFILRVVLPVETT